MRNKRSLNRLPRITHGFLSASRLAGFEIRRKKKAEEARIAPHALKGQKLLAQGSALGYHGRKPVAL